MIHIVDVLIVLVLSGAAYLGIRQGLFRQLSATAGITLGLFAVAFLYSKLVSLISHSGVRMIILVLLAAAVLLLCYSIALPLGLRLQQRLQPKKKRWFRYVDWAGGATLALFTCGLVLWIIAALFGSSTPAAVQRQLRSSSVLSFVARYAALPPVFSSIVHLLQPFEAPTAFAGSEPGFKTTNMGTPVAQEFDALDAAVARAKPSMLKVQAWGCGSTSTGSGFLVGPQLIMTNAHVIVGAERISVQDSGNTYNVIPVWFDPKTDDALLMAEVSLPATPLTLEKKALAAGAYAAVLGYPGGGELTADDATVLDLLHATGYDIYGREKTTRNIYAVRSLVIPGNSGGVLLTTGGKVAGLVFGNSTVNDKTGYAIATDQLTPALATTHTEPVDTGSCTGAKR